MAQSRYCGRVVGSNKFGDKDIYVCTNILLPNQHMVKFLKTIKSRNGKRKVILRINIICTSLLMNCNSQFEILPRKSEQGRANDPRMSITPHNCILLRHQVLVPILVPILVLIVLMRKATTIWISAIWTATAIWMTVCTFTLIWQH